MKNPKDMNDWVELAKYHKMLWVESTTQGDLTPTVFAERNGVLICSVVCPQVDKMQGIRVAAMLRKSLDADTIAIILDTHIWTGQDEANKPQNMQKACDEEGACEAGIISDCLSCFRINKQKKIQMASIPYSYYGKGTEFKWLNIDKFHERIIDEENEIIISGNVPKALRQIMDMSPIINNSVLRMVTEKMGLDEQKAIYHVARAAYQVLATDGYAVFDFLGHDKPWEAFCALQQQKM